MLLYKNILLFIVFSLVTSTSVVFGQTDCDGDIPSGTCCGGCDMPAPILCDVNDLDGYCGRTGPQNASPQYDGFCGPMTVADNPSWFGFIAGGSTVTIQMEVSNCLGNRGVQFAIYDNCIGNPPLVCESNCQGNGEIITLSIDEAVLGQTYYVMVDGCSGFGVDGDQCDYTFTILEGDDPSIDDNLSTPDGQHIVCPGQMFSYSFDAVDKAIYYGITLPDGSYVETSDQNIGFDFPEDFPPGIYEFCLEWAGNDCDTIYGPNCIDIEVQALPELEFGPFIRCEGDFPFVFRGQEYNAAGEYQYRENWVPDCDTIINVVIEEIINIKEPQYFYACQDDFPIESPFNDDRYEAPGAYPVPVIDQFGCDSTFIYDIQTIEFSFNVNADDDTLKCPEQITIINALTSSANISDGTPVDNTFITWKRNGDVLLGESDEILAVDEPGIYTFILEAFYESISCVDSFQIEIFQSLPSVPEIDIEGPQSICIGNTYSFNAPSFSNFSYNWEFSSNEGQITIREDSLSVEFEPEVSGESEICLRIENRDCPDIDTTICINIDVQPIFEVNLSFDSPFCRDDSTLVNVVDDYAEINWSNGSSGPSIYYQEEGNYAVSVTDEDGCLGITEFELEWYDLPEPEITGSTTFCSGTSTLLSLSNDYDSYEWNDGQTVDEVVIDMSGEYSVTVTDDNGCTGNTTIEVVELDEIDFDIIGDLEFCEGENTEIGVQPDFLDYSWSTSENTPNIQINAPGMYSITVTDDSDCTAEMVFEVLENVNPIPQIITDRPTLCPDEVTGLNLNAEFENIIWSTGASNVDRIEVDSEGIYTVEVTDDKGCSGTADIEIGSFEVESPEFEGPDYFCEGGNLIISLTNSFESYNWSNGTNQNTVSINQSGTYGVTVTDTNMCTSENNVDIEEIGTPFPEIQGPENLCDGETASLSGEDGFESYLWSTGEDNQNIEVTESATYIVEVTDEFGCAGTNELTVVFNPNPSPQISGSRSFCTGRTTTISAGNYESYLWSDGSTDQSLSVNVEGNYSVTVTDSNGCTGEADVDIIEADRLFPELSGDTSFCEGRSTVLDGGTSFAEYNWSNGETTSSITVSTAGEYSLTVTDADGCSGDVTAAVTENPNPEPEILGSDVFCTGKFTELSTEGYESYQWSTGSINASIQVNQPGNYSVTVTDENGCEGSASILVTELEELMPVITGDFYFCEGGSTLITAEDGYLTYEWNTGELSPELAISSPGTYILLVTDALDCSGSAQVTVSEEPLPTVNAGQDQEINCQDSTVIIGSLESDQGDNFVYYWSLLDGSERDTFSTILIEEVSQEGLYELAIINTNTGCENTDMVTVSLNDDVIRDVGLLVSQSGCFGEENGLIAIETIEGGTPPFDYFFNGAIVDDIFQRFDNLPPGNYQLRIEDSVGCDWERSIDLTTADSLGIMLEGTILIDRGDTVLLSPDISIADSLLNTIIWFQNGDIICANCEVSPLLVSPEDETLYTIRIVNEAGCIEEASIRILVRISRNVFIPSAFTPDENGVNDKWVIFGADNLSAIPLVQVFDRWGNMIFEKEDQLPGSSDGAWDGTFKGQELRPGVYVYKVNLVFDDGEEVVEYGEVTLIR